MKLTTRGKLAVAILISSAIALTVALLYDLTANLWWVGDHWCIGSAVKCLVGAL